MTRMVLCKKIIFINEFVNKICFETLYNLLCNCSPLWCKINQASDARQRHIKLAATKPHHRTQYFANRILC